MITKLKVSNFKTFDNLEIDLSKLNVIIGANASGKSNFIEIFRFLRDIVNHGLDNAISIQGGSDHITNISIGKQKDLSIEFVSNVEHGYAPPKKNIGIKTKQLEYKFSIGFKDEAKYEIKEDKLKLKCEVFKLKKDKEKLKEEGKLGTIGIEYSRENGTIISKIVNPSKLTIDKDDIISPILRNKDFISKIIPNSLIIQYCPFLIPFGINLFRNDVGIYDFDVKIPKEAAPITGKMELESDGNNLAIVLKRIRDNEKERKQFLNLLNDNLDFIEDWNVNRLADKSMLFEIKEKYFKNNLPSISLSDGTINITALIIALFFEKISFVIIEEPEKIYILL